MSRAPTAFQRTWTRISILLVWRKHGVLPVTCIRPDSILRGAVPSGMWMNRANTSWSLWAARSYSSGPLGSLQSGTNTETAFSSAASLSRLHWELAGTYSCFCGSESSHLTLCTSQPSHASGSRGNSNLKLSSSPPRRTPFPVCAKSLKSCPILRDPMDCSPPGSSVHGILQVRILERGALPSSKGSSLPRNLRKSLLWVRGCYALPFFVQPFIQVFAEH